MCAAILRKLARQTTSQVESLASGAHILLPQAACSVEEEPNGAPRTSTCQLSYTLEPALV